MKKIFTLVLCACVLALPQSTTEAHMDDDVPLRFATLEEHGYHLVFEKWGDSEWVPFWNILQKESGWRVTAQNPTSSAYGLCQTMLSLHEVGEHFMLDGTKQLEWCVDYISTRYGTPSKAWQFHNHNNWF